MYRIMIVKSKRDNYESLYQYLTITTENDETEILEIETKDELDKKVESMLNDEGYAKSDFIVVNVINYAINATDYSDDENTENAETDSAVEEDNSDENTSDETVSEDSE